MPTPEDRKAGWTIEECNRVLAENKERNKDRVDSRSTRQIMDEGVK